MKKACLVTYPPFTNGRIFDKKSDINLDNGLLFFHLLQDFFLENGVDLNTHDINLEETCDYVIYMEAPRHLPSIENFNRSFLLLFECEAILPRNWKISNHNRFAKIFTWHDDFVSGSRYFKMNFTHVGLSEFTPFNQKKKFCTLIAGNKNTSHPLELYSHRRRAIRWFEMHYPDKFDFYGIGWDIFNFRWNYVNRILNKFPFLNKARRYLARKYPSYKGKVTNKHSILNEYKFSICYENAQGFPGYITEKIFDSMAAGCIPVYWGAPNISEYIPNQCFVDKRRFETYDALYHFLSEMSEKEYNSRLEAIIAYLRSDPHEQFTPLFNARSIAKCILQ